MKPFNWITSALTIVLLTALFCSEYAIQTTEIDVYGQPDGMGIMLLVYLQVGIFIAASFLILINLLLLFKKRNRTRHTLVNQVSLIVLLTMFLAFWFR
ncbi:hypothetical protein [Halocola ammonii]